MKKEDILLELKDTSIELEHICSVFYYSNVDLGTFPNMDEEARDYLNRVIHEKFTRAVKRLSWLIEQLEKKEEKGRVV